MKRQQQGFTLIELVVVIVILAILSAFALPRFLSLTEDARVASIEGIGGSIKSASGLVRGACVIDPNCDDNNSNQDITLSNPSGDPILDGGEIKLTNGYAAASVDGILQAAQVETSGTGGGATIDNDRLILSISGSFGSGRSITISAEGASTAGNCQVEYVEADGSGAGPDITVDTSDCS